MQRESSAILSRKGLSSFLYPKTEEGMRELRRRVASMRAEIVRNKISKLDWPTSEKIRLVDAIIADTKAAMEAEAQRKK